MRAGRLNSKISIETKTENIDSVGSVVETWEPFAEVWAEVKTESGREFLSNSQQHSELSHTLTLRYLPGISNKMRVNDNGRYYNILSVFDLGGRRKELTLYCSEQL